MARLFTTGFEGRLVEAEGMVKTGAPTFDTEKQFDGTVCLKCGPSAENHATRTFTGATGTTYYFKSALRLSSVEPSATLTLMRIHGASDTQLQLETGGKLLLQNSVAGTLIAAFFTPEKEKWYQVEVKVLVQGAGKGTVAVKIYNETGETVYESGDKEAEIGNTALSEASTGHQTAGDTAVTVYVSHFAINDSTGENQNTYAGFGKVVELKPTSQTANTGWSKPGGSTEKLWESLDNRPPEGIADTTSAENAGKQIRDPNKNTTDSTEQPCPSYETAVASGGAGMKSGDTFKTIRYRARGGSTSTTSRLLAVSGVSNPEAAEVTLGTGTTIAATEPTGWSTVFTAPVYSGPALSAAPTIKLRKGTETTNALLYDLAGVIVEYLPGTAAAASARRRTLFGVGQ